MKRAPKATRDAPDVDWRLRIQDGPASCNINLEVKRRTSNLNAWFKYGTSPLPSRDISHKFSPAAADSANIAALTTFQPPDAAALRFLTDWLHQTDVVDGVLVWVEHNLRGEPLLKFIKPAKKWVEFLLAPVHPEDRLIAYHVWGTLCAPDRVPEFLDRLAERSREKPWPGHR